MKTYQVQAAAQIQAPAPLVYAIIADYRNGHPHILPPAFSNLTVEEGGVGAGTCIRFDMTALGQKQSFRAVVSEPEPGRVLVEDNGAEAGSVTTFTVKPVAQAAQVTITTVFTQRPGLSGLIERFVVKMFTRRVYSQELQLLARVAKQRQQAGNASLISLPTAGTPETR